MIRFTGDGRIASTDSDFDSELNEILNLNLSALVDRRKRVLEAFLTAHGRKGPWGPDWIRRWLSKFDDDAAGATLPEFAPVVAYYLRRKLRRAPK